MDIATVVKRELTVDKSAIKIAVIYKKKHGGA